MEFYRADPRLYQQMYLPRQAYFDGRHCGLAEGIPNRWVAHNRPQSRHQGKKMKRQPSAADLIPFWAWLMEESDSDEEETKSPAKEGKTSGKTVTGESNRDRVPCRSSSMNETHIKREPSRPPSSVPAAKRKEGCSRKPDYVEILLNMAKARAALRGKDTKTANSSPTREKKQTKLKMVQVESAPWRYTIRLEKGLEPDDIRVYVRDGNIRVHGQRERQVNDVTEIIEVNREIRPPADVVLDDLAAFFDSDGHLKLSAPLRNNPACHKESESQLVSNLENLLVNDIEKDACDTVNNTKENDGKTEEVRATCTETEIVENESGDVAGDVEKKDACDTVNNTKENYAKTGEARATETEIVENESGDIAGDVEKKKCAESVNKCVTNDSEVISAAKVYNNEVESILTTKHQDWEIVNKEDTIDEKMEAKIAEHSVISDDTKSDILDQIGIAIETVPDEAPCNIDTEKEASEKEMDVEPVPNEVTCSVETDKEATEKETFHHLTEATDSVKLDETINEREEPVCHRYHVVRVVSEEQQQLQLDENRQHLVMNLGGYEPRHVTVEQELQEDSGATVIIVNACKETEEDGIISRKQNYRKFKLPNDVKPKDLNVTLGPECNLVITSSLN